MATTHGDHTVKIFKYTDSSLYRVRYIFSLLPLIISLYCQVFYGHPRTPWTVKYHHTCSDIVASGCLGSEVCNYEPYGVSFLILMNSLPCRSSFGAFKKIVKLILFDSRILSYLCHSNLMVLMLPLQAALSLGFGTGLKMQNSKLTGRRASSSAQEGR